MNTGVWNYAPASRGSASASSQEPSQSTDTASRSRSTTSRSDPATVTNTTTVGRGKTRIDRRHASIHHRFDQLASLLGGTNRHVHRGRNASRWERGVDTPTYETPVPHGSRFLNVEAEGLVRVSPSFSILHSSVTVAVSIPICLRSAESSCSSWANFG